MKNIKRYKSVLFIALLLLVVIISGTIAYFTVNRDITNEFKALTYDVDMTEDSAETFGKKVINIVNKDEVPVVIRVSYNEVWSKVDSEYGLLTLNNLVNNVNVVDKDWSTTWLNDFVLSNDGWYYYTRVLDSKSTINLINKVSLNRTKLEESPDKDDYLSYDYELNFGFEAVQADKKAIKDLWGFDVTISDGNVKWPW